MSTRVRLAVLVSLATFSLAVASPARGDRLPRWMFWPKVEPVRAAGVEYKADNVLARNPAGLPMLQGWVKARELKTGKILWRESAYVRTPNPLAIGGPPDDDPIAKIEPFAYGLLIETKGHVHAYFDPKAKTTEWVADRRDPSTSCELHHGPLLDDLIRIQYGIARMPGSHIDPAKAPHAETAIHAGCCVMQTRSAVRYCPECRAVQAAPTAGTAGR